MYISWNFGTMICRKGMSWLGCTASDISVSSWPLQWMTSTGTPIHLPVVLYLVMMLSGQLASSVTKVIPCSVPTAC